jgi:undecaprenyl diphosphate synthase
MDNVATLPDHIAFIMDGNGRWAEKRGLPRLEGHRAGIKNARSVVKFLSKRGVKYVTLYSFSTENWDRPQDEVSGLLKIMEESIEKEALEFHKNGIRIHHLGHLDILPERLTQEIGKALELTRNNTGMAVNFAFNYGGRLEILDAVRSIMAKGIPADDIDEELFSHHLYTAGVPDVDLVIRTGGEFRISNFLLWQSAYSEYYFTEVLWPDFNTREVKKALQAYSRRKRRFGKL